MKNRMTTITGALVLAGAIFTGLGQVLSGEPPNIEAIIAAVTGLGLIGAADGGR